MQLTMQGICTRRLSSKDVETLLDCVLFGGGDFFLGGAAVDSGVGGGFVARVVLVHYVYCCRGADLVG